MSVPEHAIGDSLVQNVVEVNMGWSQKPFTGTLLPGYNTY